MSFMGMFNKRYRQTPPKLDLISGETTQSSELSRACGPVLGQFVLMHNRELAPHSGTLPSDHAFYPDGQYSIAPLYGVSGEALRVSRLVVWLAGQALDRPAAKFTFHTGD